MKLCPICQHCYDDAETVCPLDQTALVASRPGPRLIADKYRLDQLLGRGGMGAVYAGTHLDLERPVAVKLLLPDFTADSDALERFRREARAAAHIDHPNVADTYDYGLLPDGGAYIVMQLIVGQTLREFMDAAGALSVTEALNIARQIADGIEAAHRRGIVHRDLKPSNIILTREHQEQLQAKVVDFGVAKLKEHTTTGAGGLTASGSLIGTPRYMSPEQCAGHSADARSDIYSLGVMLFEMLSAHPPFDAPTATAIAIKHIQQPPPSLKEFRAEIPDALESLVSRTLDKNPETRPQSAAELSRQLQELAVALTHDERATDVSALAPLETKGRSAVESNFKTNPNQDDFKETGRTGAPTAEHPLHLPVPEDAAPVAVAAPETVTEVAARVAPQQTAAARVEGTSAQPKENNEAQLSRTHGDEGYGQLTSARPRAPMYRYLFVALLVFGLSFGAVALWVITRGTQSRQQAKNNEQTPAARQDAGEKPATTDAANPTTRGAPSNTGTGNAPVSTTPTPTGVEGVRSELRAALDEWVATTNSGDIDRQMNLYLPVLERFYQKRGVPRTLVRQEKERFLANLSSFNVQISEPEMTINADGQAATVLFRKSYTSVGAQPRSGEVVQELRWLKTAAGWKINSERDTKVIR